MLALRLCELDRSGCGVVLLRAQAQKRDGMTRQRQRQKYGRVDSSGNHSLLPIAGCASNEICCPRIHSFPSVLCTKKSFFVQASFLRRSHELSSSSTSKATVLRPFVAVFGSLILYPILPSPSNAAPTRLPWGTEAFREGRQPTSRRDDNLMISSHRHRHHPDTITQRQRIVS